MSGRLGRGRFVQSWVLNGRDDSVERDLDRIRSVYPWKSATSGQGFAVLTSQGRFDSFVSVPSTRHFLWTKVIITNRAGENEVIFYDGASASAGLLTLYNLLINPSTTDIINLEPGLLIESGLFASNRDSGIFMRALGYFIQSGLA